VKQKKYLQENTNIPTSNFCILPWIHMTSSVAGWYRVCCDSNKNLKDNSNTDNGEILHTSTTTIKEAFYSTEMNTIRQQFLNNERPNICTTCWDREDIDIASLRISMNSRFASTIRRLDFKNPKIEYLDIKYDNKCNLACRMCSIGSSDQHQKEMLGYISKDKRLPNHFDYGQHFTTHNYQKKLSNKLTTIQQKPFLENDVITALPQLKVLKVTGGEPTLNHKFLNTIDYALKNNYAKNITLDITTNGTKFTKIFLDKISQFKFIRFRISVDGTGNVYDYIRYPFKWDIFNKSVEYMFNYFKEKKFLGNKAAIGFSIVVQPYNIFKLDELFQWGHLLFQKYYTNPEDVGLNHIIDINTDFQMIPYESELNVSFLDHKILYKALKIFEDKTKHIMGIGPRLDVFKNFITNLPNNKSLQDFKHYQLKQTTKFLDEGRKQDYHDHLDPIMCQYLDNAPLAPWEKKNNGFCILPWIHLSTRTTGNMQLCCTANSGSDKNNPMIGCNRKNNGDLVNLKYDNWKDNWNTNYMKNVRSEMMKGNKPKECRKCYFEEDLGYNSKRIWENKKWQKKLL